MSSSQKKPLREKFSAHLKKRSEQALRKHEERLQELSKKISKAKQKQWKNADRNETKQKQYCRKEIETLEHKERLLENQKKQFLRARCSFEKRTESNPKISDRDIQILRGQFEVECRQFEQCLPVYAHKSRIIDTVKKNRVSIISAEAESGKSTQIVQYLLETDLVEKGTIVCTQPGKYAAVSLAMCVAEELNTVVGQEIGYEAGTKCERSDSTKVVFMTDEALLDKCCKDPSLGEFSCIVVDEAHERSLYTDLLLGMIKRCLNKRPELRVIITSATIDPEDPPAFVKFFGDERSTLDVSGVTFPVEVIFEGSDDEEDDFENYESKALEKAIDIHKKEPPGGILVFLASPSETENCCRSFEEKMKGREDFQCFALHGQLQPQEQQEVQKPLGKNKRKIVFATNCAETSITIGGIKYVVDTGMAKEMCYDAKKNVNSLSVTIISRSSADQRKERADRTAPGKCYRLYSRRSFQAMAAGIPTILKTNLEMALLKLAQLDITPDTFDFVQSPSPDAINAALESLVQLGAMENGKITETGRWMARLPFDPKLGLLTLLGKNEDILYDAIVLAAVISAGIGVFKWGTSEEAKRTFNKAMVKFCSSKGDIMTYLAVYKEWQVKPEREKRNWCMDNNVNARTMEEIDKAIEEVICILKTERDLEIDRTFSAADDALQEMLVKCYACNLCHYLGRERAGYFAARSRRKVYVHPASSLHALNSFPEWVVYTENLKTSRDFIRLITPVKYSWLDEATVGKFGSDVKDIQKKEVVSVFTQPAGSRVFSALVGPSYSKLTQYEESLSNSSAVFTVEANPERGEVEVFSTDRVTADDFKETFAAIIEKTTYSLEKQEEEVAVGNEDSGVRAVLGAGGQVVEILMPNQSRKVFIHQPADGATEESIRQKFEQFGTIIDCKKLHGMDVWGYVIFGSSGEAAEAVERTKADDRDKGQLEKPRRAKQNSALKARLSWFRRPCTGNAYVTVTSPDFFLKCTKMGVLQVAGTTVKIEEDTVKKNRLLLTGLPHEITDGLIKESLLIAGKETDERIVKPDILRTIESTQDDLVKFKTAIAEELQKRLQCASVQVTVAKPSKKDIMFQAEAFFSDFTEGIRACKRFYLRRQGYQLIVTVVPVIPNNQFRLLVHTRIFQTYQAEYRKVKEDLTLKGVEIDTKDIPPSQQSLIIKAQNNEDAAEAKTTLITLFKGDQMDCETNPNLHRLLTPAGRKILNGFGKEVGACVFVDNRLNTITIHGSPEAREKVRSRIDRYVEDLQNGTPEEVTLKGSENPPGLLKALITKHGDDLDGFRSDLGLHSVTVDYSKHQLTLNGTPESLQKAKSDIEEVKQQLWAASKKANPKDPKDDIECPVCLCPIEISELYRLEICAHPYCRSCVKTMVTAAIKAPSFPVICCFEGCGKPLAWQDFKTLARGGDIELSALTAAALSAFVRANRDAAEFCSTPDCPIVYHVSSKDDAKTFLCPQCGVSRCTACHNQAHVGLTCAQWQSSKEEVPGVEAWVREDPEWRRICPGCGSPIEKIDGCKKMHCEACHAIFCWRCREKFPSAKDCYDHLAKKCGGIF